MISDKPWDVILSDLMNDITKAIAALDEAYQERERLQRENAKLRDELAELRDMLYPDDQGTSEGTRGETSQES